MTNCCLIDFKGMLENGFKIGNAEVESPKSIQTATAQISQIIANVASSQYGGCSADRIDEVLLRMQRRITRSTSRMRKSGSYLINGKITLGRKRKRTSTMPCNLSSMKSTPSSLQMDKHLLLRSVLVWEPIVLSVKFKSYFDHSYQGSWFRTSNSHLP